MEKQQWYNPVNDVRKQFNRSVFAVSIQSDEPEADYIKGHFGL